MKKDEFKEFVREHPVLVNYVKKDEMTWQKFYEMYDLYGKDDKIWDSYLNESEPVKETVKDSSTIFGIHELANWLKNIDLDGLQEGIGNVQRVLGVVQDFSNKESKKEVKETYKPRPLYKHFED